MEFGSAGRAAAIGFLAIFFAGCSQNVSIPPANQDAPPVITWNALIVQQPSGYSGDVQPGKENVTVTTTVNITQGARVQLSGSAKNPGGVKQFQVTAKQSGILLAQVTAVGTPDSNGRVPDLLSVLGSNGAGAPGNQPIVVVMSAPVIVTASATNFNAMSSQITVTYNPATVSIVGEGGGSNPPPPMTAAVFLTANHDLGPFQTQTAPPNFCQASLTWSLTAGTLTGTTGQSTPFTNTINANPAPSWIYNSAANLYTARCSYGQMIGGLRSGSWSISVNGSGAGSPWQTQCQAVLSAGMNARIFTWGQTACQ